MPGLSHDSYDIVVGIPSFNNETTIKYVVETAAIGLKQYFPSMRGCIVNADGGSTDRTKEMFYSASSNGVDLLSFIYEGISGKGSAMRSIMEKSKSYGAQAVLFLDSDLRSVEPFWIERLASPILEEGAAYVTPYYIRHKYDGTITNSICYPLNTALYGKKIRQPIGGDFGVGRELLEYYTTVPENTWRSDISRFGIDIWMTTSAVNEVKGSIYQAALGTKIHDVKDPGKQLGNMFKEVVGTLFSLMQKYEDNWKTVGDYSDSPIYGDVVTGIPEPLEVDLENMISKCYEGIHSQEDFIKDILGAKIARNLLLLGKSDAMIDDDLWVRIIYRIASGYRKLALRDRLIELLVPLYFGRVASFVSRTEKMTQEGAEEEIDKLLKKFVETKDELISIWEKSSE
ncbi:glycosyltransferase family 2 protein [Mesotoga sp. H07.pep.5.3]|uniref:glycosyltransferase family 2 protein n=1 Tax=Mesotoga sp. H07.pep.5.3 TaxID=1421003 RepID=UPI000C1A2E46|nr:glycosyltransferase [Mesotoga sp. H07.pep.5.3]PIJ63574.1 glycosyltransferase [Mesotoga sp. H07.pep.5.3]